jgi:Inactive DUF488-N3 subclade
MARVQIKRIYDSPARVDGFRVLVDRLWPRGISKERAAIDLWMKSIAPSTELRRWFGHEAMGAIPLLCARPSEVCRPAIWHSVKTPVRHRAFRRRLGHGRSP